MPSGDFAVVRVPPGGRTAPEIVHFLASRFANLAVPTELQHAQVRSEAVMTAAPVVEEASPPPQSQVQARSYYSQPAPMEDEQAVWSSGASAASTGLSETDQNRVPVSSGPAQVKAFKRLGAPSAGSRPIHARSGASAASGGDGGRQRDGRTKLNFPIAEIARGTTAMPKRSTVVPDTFESAAKYQHVWSSALHEEINLSLHDNASALLSAAKTVAPSQCGGQPTAVLNWLAHADGAAAKRVQGHARKCGVGLYTQATLRKHTGSGGQGRWKKKRSSSDDEDEDAAKQEPKFFLKLQDRENYKEFSKDMLFIVASNLSFRAAARLDFVGFLRSHWHGPSSSDGSLEVGWVGDAPHFPANKEQKVFVLRGPQINSELAMLDALEQAGLAAASGSQTSGKVSPVPLLPAILHPPTGSTAVAPSVTEGDVICAAVSELVSKVGLNAEQASVLQAAASWFAPGEALRVPTEQDQGGQGILLVHGVFGAGKSMTLRALTKLLVDLSKMKGVCFRRLGQNDHVPKSANAQRPRGK